MSVKLFSITFAVVSCMIQGLIGEVHECSGVQHYEQLKNDFQKVTVTIIYFISPDTKDADEINNFMNEISIQKEFYILKVNTTVNDNDGVLSQYETPVVKLTNPSFVIMQNGEIIIRINGFYRSNLKCYIKSLIVKVHECTGVQRFNKLKNVFQGRKATVLYFIEPDTNEADEITHFLINKYSHLKKWEIYIVKVDTTVNDNELVLSQCETPEVKLTKPSFVILNKGMIFKRIIGFDKDEINNCITDIISIPHTYGNTFEETKYDFIHDILVRDNFEELEQFFPMKDTVIIYFVKFQTLKKEEKKLNVLADKYRETMIIRVYQDTKKGSNIFNKYFEKGEAIEPFPKFVCLKKGIVAFKNSEFDWPTLKRCIRGENPQENPGDQDKPKPQPAWTIVQKQIEEQPAKSDDQD